MTASSGLVAIGGCVALALLWVLVTARVVAGARDGLLGTIVQSFCFAVPWSVCAVVVVGSGLAFSDRAAALVGYTELSSSYSVHPDKRDILYEHVLCLTSEGSSRTIIVSPREFASRTCIRFASISVCPVVWAVLAASVHIVKRLSRRACRGATQSLNEEGQVHEGASPTARE